MNIQRGKGRSKGSIGRGVVIVCSGLKQSDGQEDVNEWEKLRERVGTRFTGDRGFKLIGMAQCNRVRGVQFIFYCSLHPLHPSHSYRLCISKQFGRDFNLCPSCVVCQLFCTL